MPFATTWMYLEMIRPRKSERERHIPDATACMWNLSGDRDEHLWETETDAQPQRTDGVARGSGGGGVRKDGLGVWGWQMQTVSYRMDKRGPPVQHRELDSISCDKPKWGRTSKSTYVRA